MNEKRFLFVDSNEPSSRMYKEMCVCVCPATI